jgi:hypothetical protein
MTDGPTTAFLLFMGFMTAVLVFCVGGLVCHEVKCDRARRDRALDERIRSIVHAALTAHGQR